MTDGAPLLADIRWTCEPVPRPEQIGVDDLLALDRDALLLHVVDLHEALCSVRQLAHQALALVADRDQALAAASRRQTALVDEIRRYTSAQVTPHPKPRDQAASSYWT